LGVAGASLLAACGGVAPSTKPAAPAAGATDQSLRIALFGTREDAERRAALIPPFNKLYPRVKIEYTPIQGTDWDEYFSKVATMKAANTAPDITFVATEGTH